MPEANTPQEQTLFEFTKQIFEDNNLPNLVEMESGALLADFSLDDRKEINDKSKITVSVSYEEHQNNSNAMVTEISFWWKLPSPINERRELEVRRLCAHLVNENFPTGISIHPGPENLNLSIGQTMYLEIGDRESLPESLVSSYEELKLHLPMMILAITQVLEGSPFEQVIKDDLLFTYVIGNA